MKKNKDDLDKNIQSEEENEEVTAAAGQEEETEAEEKAAPDTDIKTVLPMLAKKIKALEETNAEYLKSWQRERADFDNFKRRNQAASTEAYQNGTADAISAILPVMDNFERALGSVAEEEKELPFVKGVSMVYKQMQDILTGLGLEEIAAEGECFDPNLHHAVMQEPAQEGEEEGNVKEVFNKGYMLNGKVLRHCMVKVIG